MSESCSVAARERRGRAVRRQVRRSDLGAWDPGRRRHDAVQLLAAQAADRVPELVPIRHGRMAASAFAHYRGGAAIMAADLATRPNTGLVVQLCGDAHLSNFGAFESPERDLLFDLNDFDETFVGPFEWDVQRLVASLAIAARSRGFRGRIQRQAATAAARAYCSAMAGFAGMRNLEVWYASLDVAALQDRLRAEQQDAALERSRKLVAKARAKDHLRAAGKLTEVVDGALRFRDDPPLLVRAEHLSAPGEGSNAQHVVRSALRSYRSTLLPDRRHLLDQYRYVDLARKVVGVGSVGTRAWVTLLVGRDDGDPLVLQVKQAQRSVLEAHLSPGPYRNEGRRVVEGQRLMQAASDILLGWQRVVGLDGIERDFYVRQLWDGKASADVEAMEPATLVGYGEACAWTLARAHARSGDRVAIAAYLGGGSAFAEALGEFAVGYADQNEADHAAFVAAIEAGRLEARTGV